MGTKSLQRVGLRFARYPVWAALCALPAFVACSDDDDNGSLPGEIGNNHFFYGCATIDDAHCRDELTFFPEKIAVGARFELIAKADNGSRLTVRPASPVMVAPVSGEFEFLRSGFGAFLAFNFNEFVDFVHLEGVQVEALDVLDAFGAPKDDLVLRRNQRTTLTAAPLDATGDTLAGSLSYRWVSDNDAVLKVADRGTTVSVTALEEGEARLRVSLGNNLSRTLNVVVTNAIVAPVEDGGSSDAGTNDAAPDGGAPNDIEELDARAPNGDGPDASGGDSTSDAPTNGDESTISLAAESSGEGTGTDAALDGGLQ